MVSVTMAADPPAYNPDTSIVIFEGGRGQREQIHAYYEAHFRTGPHMRPMETFAQFVLEKGYGTMAPPVRVDGKEMRETWQARGRRLFGQRFIAIMEKAVTEYCAAHGGSPPPPAAIEPPAHILEEIPDPEF